MIQVIVVHSNEACKRELTEKGTSQKQKERENDQGSTRPREASKTVGGGFNTVVVAVVFHRRQLARYKVAVVNLSFHEDFLGGLVGDYTTVEVRSISPVTPSLLLLLIFRRTD